MLKLKQTNVTRIFALILVTILLTNFVSAFGVSSSFWKGNPLRIAPGETIDIDLRLQNMVGTGDTIVRASLGEGAGIATIEEKDYLVKSGTKDTKVPIRITIPEDAIIGQTHQVTIDFSTVTKASAGTLTIGTAIGTTFDVEIVAESPMTLPTKPESTTTFPMWLLTLTIVAIMLIIIMIIVKAKRKTKKR